MESKFVMEQKIPENTSSCKIFQHFSNGLNARSRTQCQIRWNGLTTLTKDDKLDCGGGGIVG